MGLLDYEEKEDDFWKTMRDQAKEAMNDREVGLLGQIQASKDYEKYSKKVRGNK